MSVVAVAEGDALTVEENDPGVTDGDAVGVVGEIREHLRGSAEGWLAVHDPVGRGGSCHEQVESDRVGEHSFGELERSLAPCFSQEPRQQASKAARQHLDRKQESGFGRGTPSPVVNREAAARHDAVDVRVERQCLAPGVKHAQAAGLDLKTGMRNVDERRSGGPEQQVVEDARCVQSENVEHLGHGEDHVEIGNGKKLSASSLEPSLASCGTTSRAGAVPAGVPLNVLVTTPITLLPLPAEGGRPACADRTQGLALRSRGSAVAQKGRASSSYDRAEVRLGGHTSLGRAGCGSLQNAIEGACDVPQHGRRHVRISLGRVNVRVTEEHLHHTRARTLLDQVRGIAVA